ncbi:hypothetical protein [Legionella waltersii]|uniref:hypothetical protein n=1 Tax=Legionella waltersii TaxID=66969 RepID=UPI0010558DB9|nr:hypothetical protein [Legionella waltersii]
MVLEAFTKSIDIILRELNPINNINTENYKKELQSHSQALNCKLKIYLEQKNEANPYISFMIELEITADKVIKTLHKITSDYFSNIQEEQLVEIRKALLSIQQNLIQFSPPNRSAVIRYSNEESIMGLFTFRSFKFSINSRLISLARDYPINDVCPIDLEEIPENYKLYTYSGHVFNIINLVEWQSKRKPRIDLDETNDSIKV